LGLTFTDKLLKRKHNTTSQTLLNSKERRKNLRNAFKTGKISPEGKNILLVDDVFTTGTTVNEASKILMAAGAKQVFVLTACHGT
jgi:ComF family protein